MPHYNLKMLRKATLISTHDIFTLSLSHSQDCDYATVQLEDAKKGHITDPEYFLMSNEHAASKYTSIYTERKKKRIFTLNVICIKDVLFL